MSYRIWMAAAILCCAIPAFAQQNSAPAATAKVESNPIANQLRSDVAESARNMVGAAQEMPAEKYSYRPTPEQITFAHLIVHATMANYGFCSKLSGVARPEVKLAEADGKDKLVAALKDSYAYCTTNLANVDDSNLGETLPFYGGRTISRGGMMTMVSVDYADHYAMAAMYLRLNGLLPPTAKEKK
ncbi:MAG: DinB family protein [Candidatus Acidiferrales bacterium]